MINITIQSLTNKYIYFSNNVTFRVIRNTSAGKTALHRAAMSGQNDGWKTLIQGKEDLNARDSSGDTALHWAARKGLRIGVICLLEAGADFDLRNYEGNRPIDVTENDEVTRLELNIRYQFPYQHHMLGF